MKLVFLLMLFYTSLVAAEELIFFPNDAIPSTSTPKQVLPIPTPTPPLAQSTPVPVISLPESIIPENCGVPGQLDRRLPHSRVRRIAKGIQTKKGRWPWLAAVGYKRRGGSFNFFCGGTIITRHHILTAALCVKSPNFIILEIEKSELRVRVGVYNISVPDEGQELSIASIVSGPSYNQASREDDIAIITLDANINFSPFSQPACLPFHLRENNLMRRMLAVVGWGWTTIGNPHTTEVPQETGVQVVDLATCKSRYQRGELKITELHLCAGTGGRDICKGDNGGPLNFLGSDGRYYVVGIASFGGICGHANFPSVYTRVTTYLDWILNNLQ